MNNAATTNMSHNTTNTKKEPLLPPSSSAVSSSWPDEVSPQTSSSDGEWPSIYEESYEMLLAAIMLYGVVDLRKLATQTSKSQNRLFCVEDDVEGGGTNCDHTAKEKEQLVQLPISSQDIVRLLRKNKSVIESSEMLGEESTELYLDAFGEIMKDDSPTDGSLEIQLQSNGSYRVTPTFDFVHVGDQNPNRELVYGICIHHSRRRITVIFRGCQSRKDWSVCSETYLTEILNPVIDLKNGKQRQHQQDDEEDEDVSETISIHRGFYRYLFRHNTTETTIIDCSNVDDMNNNYDIEEEEEDQVVTGETFHENNNSSNSSNNNNNNNDNNNNKVSMRINKFDEIVDQIQKLQQQHPEYKVYITGHSLGGALATVFAFHYAALIGSESEMATISSSGSPTSTTLSESGGSNLLVPTQQQSQPQPVTCITIASPMVGNITFEKAFKTLESRRQLRCLRITNHHDIFTQLPDRSLSLYVFAMYFWSFFYYVGGSWLFFIFCNSTVYRHVGLDLHLYYQPGKYKIKNTRGSATTYMWRVMKDWKRHMKQTVQRILTVPFFFLCDFCYCKTNFNVNHGVQEHIKRLKHLQDELGIQYLNDMYEEKRFSYRGVNYLDSTANYLIDNLCGGSDGGGGCCTNATNEDFDNGGVIDNPLQTQAPLATPTTYVGRKITPLEVDAAIGNGNNNNNSSARKDEVFVDAV